MGPARSSFAAKRSSIPGFTASRSMPRSTSMRRRKPHATRRARRGFAAGGGALGQIPRANTPITRSARTWPRRCSASTTLERQTFLLKHIEGWRLDEIAESLANQRQQHEAGAVPRRPASCARICMYGGANHDFRPTTSCSITTATASMPTSVRASRRRSASSLSWRRDCIVSSRGSMPRQRRPTSRSGAGRAALATPRWSEPPTANELTIDRRPPRTAFGVLGWRLAAAACALVLLVVTVRVGMQPSSDRVAERTTPAPTCRDGRRERRVGLRARLARCISRTRSGSSPVSTRRAAMSGRG